MRGIVLFLQMSEDNRLFLRTGHCRNFRKEYDIKLKTISEKRQRKKVIDHGRYRKNRTL